MGVASLVWDFFLELDRGGGWYSIGNIAQFKMVNFILCDSHLKTNCRKSPVTGEEVLSEYAAKKLGKKDFIGLSVSKSILFWLL